MFVLINSDEKKNVTVSRKSLHPNETLCKGWREEKKTKTTLVSLSSFDALVIQESISMTLSEKVIQSEISLSS